LKLPHSEIMLERVITPIVERERERE